MARLYGIDADADEFRARLTRALQSSHVSFLFGSGASAPAIPVAGGLEATIEQMLTQGKHQDADRGLCSLLRAVQEPTNTLFSGTLTPQLTEVVASYRALISVVHTLLFERRTRLRPAQVALFTTNYDLLIEYACSQQSPVMLNDGFARVPAFDERVEFAPHSFFNTVSNVGSLYNYRVDVPCINLIKLHGSLSWAKSGGAITCSFKAQQLPADDASPAELAAYLDGRAVVLPLATKHRTSVMEQTYYDLFRIYANELDKENSLLIAFGFSFSDTHILQVTRRALRNPTMWLVVFAYDSAAADSLRSIFSEHPNVAVVSNGDQPLSFEVFNALLNSCVRPTAS